MKDFPVCNDIPVWVTKYNDCLLAVIRDSISEALVKCVLHLIMLSLPRNRLNCETYKGGVLSVLSPADE